MTIPAQVASDLVVIQAQIFGVFKVFFDMPPASTGMDHLPQRGGRCSEDEVVAEIMYIGHASTQQEPMLPIMLPVMQDGHTRPVKEAGTFGAFAHREALPRLLRQHKCWDVCDMDAPASSIRGYNPNGFIAVHLQHIRISMSLQPGAQVQILPIDTITHDPGNGNLGIPHPLEQASGQVWFCLETNGWGDAGCLSALVILSPLREQIEFAVNEGVPTSGDVGKKDPHLAVLHLPRRAAILFANPSRVSASFGKAGL